MKSNFLSSLGLFLASMGVFYHLVVFVTHFTKRGKIFARDIDTAVHYRMDDKLSLSSSLEDTTTNTAHINYSSTIKSINLIGERHSGTKWITSHLKDCFGEQILVQNRYTRFKHWFQYDDDISKDEENYHPTNSSLVVSIFRDPYDWVDAMIRKPYHSPNHFDLEWKEFVTTPWTIGYRWRGDEDIIRTGTQDNATCMHRFSFNEIIPCSELDRNMNNITRNGNKVGVVYELNHDGSGKAYGSILELRRDKVKNFLNVAKFDGVASFIPVRYEELVSRGTRELIGQIENITGIHAKCKVAPPGEPRTKVLDYDYMQWMSEHIDWEVENLIGYSRRDIS